MPRFIQPRPFHPPPASGVRPKPNGRVENGFGADTAELLDALAPRRRKTERRSGVNVKALTLSAKQRQRDNDWVDAKPGEVVALQALCHELVYGVLPVMTSKDWMGAISAARAHCRRHFDGDVEQQVDYVRWVWTRERSRELYRRQTGNEGAWRVTWRQQFVSGDLTTDYLVAEQRAQPHSRSRPI